MNASMARANSFYVCFILEKTNQFLFYLFYAGSLNLYIVHCMYAKLTLVCIKKKVFSLYKYTTFSYFLWFLKITVNIILPMLIQVAVLEGLLCWLRSVKISSFLIPSGKTSCNAHHMQTHFNHRHLLCWLKISGPQEARRTHWSWQWLKVACCE